MREAGSESGECLMQAMKVRWSDVDGSVDGEVLETFQSC